jgi:tetratricopeptide (TPR) repeat protein
VQFPDSNIVFQGAGSNLTTLKFTLNLAQSIMVGYCMRQGNYPAAITKCKQILAATKDLNLNKYALYDLGTIYWYFLDDPKTGENYLRQLISAFPKDDLSISALATLGEWKPDAPQKPAPTESPDAIPVAFSLLQNYPNPFNPETEIQYSLPDAGKVSIKIYDIQGREVQTLVETSQPAGVHTIKWNGQDQNGLNVASGMYFYRILYNGKILNKKMMIIR